MQERSVTQESKFQNNTKKFLKSQKFRFVFNSAGFDNNWIESVWEPNLSIITELILISIIVHI